MKIPPSLLVASLLASVASLAHGAPFYGWTEDYTGNEANTIALWKFNTATGTGTNSYSGDAFVKPNLSFSPAFTATGITGKFGEAFSVTGSPSPASNTADANGWAATPTLSSGSQPLFNATAMSFEFWFQPTALSLGNANNRYFYDQKLDTAFGTQFSIRNVTGATNELRFSVGNGTTSATITTGSLDWSVGTWYHLAATFEVIDDTAVLNIYRDGILLTTGTDNIFENFGNVAPGSRRYRIGNRNASAYAALPGVYDNFRISNVAYEYAAIPEPGAVGLLSAPLIFLAVRQLRRKSAHA